MARRNMNKKTERQADVVRADIARLMNLHPNATQKEIAKLVGRSEAAVSKHLKIMHGELIEDRREDFAAYRTKTLLSIRQMREEAYNAWIESKASKETEYKEKSGSGGEGRMKVWTKTEKRDPDSEYLKVMLACHIQEGRLMGMNDSHTDEMIVAYQNHLLAELPGIIRLFAIRFKAAEDAVRFLAQEFKRAIVGADAGFAPAAIGPPIETPLEG